MTELEALNSTINELNNIWPLLNGEEKNKVLDERDKLDELASAMAHKTINEGVNEFEEAIISLKDATLSANEVKDAINNKIKRAEKVAKLISKTSKAVGKVAGLIAVL